MGKLSDGTEGLILLDMGVSKSFMSKRQYLRGISLYSFPQFASKNSEKSRRKYTIC